MGPASLITSYKQEYLSMKTRIRTLLLPIFLGLLFTTGFLLVMGGMPDVSLAVPTACVAGPHSGEITGTQQWCADDGPHLLTGDVTVPEGMTLTIEAGTTLQGARYVELLVAGRLEALGTASQPITLTSSIDSGPEQWSGLAFDGGSGHLQYATVRYGGDRNSIADSIFGNPYHRSNITTRNSDLRLENVTVRDLSTPDVNNNNYGLLVSNSYLVISNTIFTVLGSASSINDNVPIRLMGADTVLEMSNVTFTNNTNERILLDTGAMMGHDTTLTTQPGLEGYELPANFSIPPTVTLTVEPKVTVMSNTALHQNIIIQGHLNALGTPTNPITFTSVADSGPGQWAGLVFVGGTGHLRHTTVRYAGQRDHVTDSGLGPWARSGISVRDVLTGELRLENVVIRDIATSDQDMGIYLENSNLVVQNSLFTGIGNGSYYIFPDTPIYIAGGDSVVTMINNTFTANNANRIVLQPDTMMKHDTSLPPQNGLDGYLLEDDLRVPPTVTLTLEPGATLMGGGTSELLIQGHLDAIGTPKEPITFTSETDSAPRNSGLVWSLTGA